MEEGSPTLKGEIDSNIGGLKDEKKLEMKKKALIGNTIGVGVLLLIILIIIIVKVGQNKNSETDDDIYGKDVLGEIECVYYISSSSEETNILGKEFDKSFLLSIEVNGVKIKYSKYHKFNTTGKNTVKYYIYDQIISIANMFKDVSTLSSVKIYSNVNLKIKSMESLF